MLKRRMTGWVLAGLLLAGLLVGCVHLQARPAAPGPGEIEYTVEAAGLVSLAVYDAEGRMVRTLLSGVEQDAGTHRTWWDGRDRMGQPVEPGSYQWRLLATPGFTARFIGPLGANPAHDEPWSEGFGNHAGPQAVAVADGRVVLSAGGENIPATFCQSLDGRQVFWKHGPNPRLAKVRIVDGRVIGLAIQEWNVQADLIVLDLASGRQLQRFDIKRGDDPSAKATERWRRLGGYRMATDGTLAAVGYPEDKRIVLYDLATGKAVREIADIEAIHDLEYADGVLHALANGHLQRERDGRFETVIPAAALVEPRVVAYDAHRREWLIAEDIAGADAGGQIKRFNAGGGLLAAYGRAGGRRDGRWSAVDFDEILGLAALDDGSGGFFVGEGYKAIRRLVRLDAQGGVAREWFGPQEFYNFSAADPGDPTRVVFYSGSASYGVARMDYATGAWTLEENYRATHLGELFPRTDHWSVRWWPLRRNGRLYLVADAGHAGILRVDPAVGRLVPVAAAGPIVAAHPILQAAAVAQGLDLSRQAGFIWTDPNGNGVIEAEEVRFSDVALPHGRLHVDDNWNVSWRSLYWSATEPEPAWMQLPNEGDAAAEAPRWGAPRVAEALLPAAALGLHGSGTDGLRRDAAGATYLLMNGNRAGGDRHGDSWPTMSIGSARLIKWRADGSLDWVVGKAAVEARYFPDRPHDPATFHEPTGLPGLIRGNLVVADKSFAPATVFAEDGLYTGSFLDHRANDGLPDHVYVWWRDRRTEQDGPIPYDTLRGGSVVEHQGRVYWFPMGNQYTPVYEITGWDGWRRQTGTVAASAVAVPGQGTGLRGEVFANMDFTGAPVAIATPRLWCVPGPAGRVPAGRVDWSAGPVPGIGTNTPFAVRWEGGLEAMFTEPWRLAVYNHDTRHATHGPGWDRTLGTARVWLGGALVVDTSTGVNRSREMMLDAGRKYALRVDMTHTGTAAPEFSLCWDSTTQERQRIPGAYLHPDATPQAPSLALRVETPAPAGADGERIVRLVASRPAEADLAIRLAVDGDAAAFDGAPPGRVTLPAGQASVEWRVRPRPSGRFARLNVAVEPTAGWRIEPEAAAVDLLTGERSDLFAFAEGETVVLADDFAQPDVWGIVGRLGRFEGGAFGPVVPGDGRANSAWRSLPMPLDARRYAVVFYLRGRTPGPGHGGSVGHGFDKNKLGMRIIPGDSIVLSGHSAHHTGMNTRRFDKETVARQQAGEALDYRAVFTVRDGRLHGEAFVRDAAGAWQSLGGGPMVCNRGGGDMRVPPPTARIEMGGRNGSGASIEAVAVTLAPIEKPIKDLAADFPKFRWLLQEPAGLDLPVIEEMRAACEQRQQAFGLCIGYPGFQGWMGAVEGGVEPLSYAECDTPEILQEWLELDLAYGTRVMELLISIKPDYLLFGGSGTITLASPDLARKYAIPALKRWSAMTKAAGIPTMLHSCGKSRALVDLLCDETDVNCINPLEIAPMGDVDLAEVKRARGHQISLMGNLHTTNVMLRGTPDDVRAAARQALRDAGQGGGFILSTGDQCGPATPEENLFALVETAKMHGIYDRQSGEVGGA